MTNAYVIFDEVCKQGSFIRASTILHLTPSAVSHSISALEEEWGFTLFIRERTGVRLTNEGEKMLGLVRSLLEKEEEISEEAARINDLNSGKVTIGAFSSICIRWIPEIVTSFCARFPGIDVQILQGDYQDVIDWVRTGVVEIGFDTLPTGAGFDELPLYREPILCVAPKNFRPGSGSHVTPGDIEGQNLILQRSGYSADTMAYIRKHKINVRTDFFIDDDQSIQSLVEVGLGISLMPELIVKDTPYDVKVFPLRPEEHRTIGLIMRKKDINLPAVIKMKEHILDFIKNRHLYDDEFHSPLG